ncbi:MAG: poly-beta-1,6-N-acetyl-D-glucosamine biosynthesis protein PgaD [Candidatus Omnitrophica bacterium]|nr:poly-beta-1,6-N-acetyl-D-glucosamine biosynthesis protein PgaD [Candidatus Omnitrophota bacterium]
MRPVPQEDPRKEYEKLIIDRPKILSNWRRGIEVSMTTIGWAVFLFLFRPVALFFIWLLGFKLFYHQMVELEGLQEFRRFWFVYLTVCLAIILVVRLWGVYNKVKFGGRERRKFTPPAVSEDIEKHFQLPAQAMQEIISWKDMSVDFLENHAIGIQSNMDSSAPKITGHFQSD